METVFGFDFRKTFVYENGFYLTSPTPRLAKSIAHWELYKRIVGLPGVVVECGVFKGASLIRFATYREILESGYSRKIIGFDAFGKFPNEVASSEDKSFIEKFEADAGDGISKEELGEVLRKKNLQNITLVKGFIPDTFSSYFQENPATQIALLHIDVDVYESTKACLECLYDRVVRGGLVVLDDYGQVAGATKAINEFVAKKEKEITIIQKLPYNYIPAFMVKE